jgi:hypothetical protein
MLYLIHGSDWQKARAKAREILNSLQKKKPEAVVVSLEEGGVSEAKIEELAGSQGLFERKFIVFSDRACVDLETTEIIEKKLPVIAASENIFVFLEEELEADLLKVFKKHSEKAQEFKKVEKKERFNSFLLADALGQRNKERLWVLYHQALHEGIVAEELHGTLFWQLKALRSATIAKTASEAGLKSFSWTKAKSFLRRWKPEELREASNKMVSLYHDSRRGEYELQTALEKFILDL